MRASLCFGQEASPTPSPSEMEAEPVVVTATRFDIPLDQSPASVSVIIVGRFRAKANRARERRPSRSAGALGRSNRNSRPVDVSFYARIAQRTHAGLARWHPDQSGSCTGAFNFADLTIDDIDRIEVVRGPQSTLYGPRALAGVIQIFTKQGTGTPGVIARCRRRIVRHLPRNGARATAKSVTLIIRSAQAASTQTTRVRTINYRNTAAITDVGWSPDEQLRIGSLFTYSVSDTGNPNTIFDPRPIDHFLTERWLIGSSHRLEAGRLVGAQIDCQLRSRATNKRSE